MNDGAGGAGVRVAELTFSDGTRVDLRDTDVIVIVGPNNSGKSCALRDINARVCAPSRQAVLNTRVVTSLDVQRYGTEEEVWNLLRQIGAPAQGADDSLMLSVPGQGHGTRGARRHEILGWSQGDPNASPFHAYFVAHLSASNRQALSDPQQAIDFGRQSKFHPLHHLHQSRALRRRLEAAFKEAFDTEIGIDLHAGSIIPIHVGANTQPADGEDERSERYRDRLRKYPRISEEGDGIRSFVGILLHCMTAPTTVNIIDEPEAFLHPPQARILARMLCEYRAPGSQLFLATHSTDILRGVLAAQGVRSAIIRLRREGTVNAVRTLAQDDINEVWADPVLRYSNILDGLFYEQVVVCEADGDCRFYQAIADALREPQGHGYLRDVMFTQAGGKGGIPKLVRSLKKLGVPVVAVADFDILRSGDQCRGILSAMGIDQAEVRSDWQAVRANIYQMGSAPVSAIKQSIRSLLDSVSDSDEQIRETVVRQIKNELNPHIGWQRAKTSGLTILGLGAPSEAGKNLLAALAAARFLVVPEGELESFCRSAPADKNEWVIHVLERYQGCLATSPDLEAARRFVTKMIEPRPPVE